MALKKETATRGSWKGPSFVQVKMGRDSPNYKKLILQTVKNFQNKIPQRKNCEDFEYLLICST